MPEYQTHICYKCGRQLGPYTAGCGCVRQCGCITWQDGTRLVCGDCAAQQEANVATH
jgi:hypothetical protein